ncbi:MAG: dockerin type I repeat-containing protein [Oscillospiraceae bacterium]|jgi:hypothetical protein|nr:dockerin type I repeat-containing protein [Oscillospiraceae bacterium]
MKKLVSLALVITIVLSFSVIAGASQVAPYSLGDVNGDGFIDSADALEILKYEIGLPNVIEGNPRALAAADIFGNGVVDSRVALEIMKFEIGLPSVFDNINASPLTLQIIDSRSGIIHLHYPDSPENLDSDYYNVEVHIIDPGFYGHAFIFRFNDLYGHRELIYDLHDGSSGYPIKRIYSSVSCSVDGKSIYFHFTIPEEIDFNFDTAVAIRYRIYYAGGGYFTSIVDEHVRTKDIIISDNRN